MKKVVLTYRDVSGNVAVESIWAEPIGMHYKVDNIPFFAPNIALNDIISVEKEEGVLHFEELISPSGHSTIQIVMLNRKEKNRIIEEIESLNCSWEGFKDSIIALDIPATFDYRKIKEFLQRELNNQVLDYKEACLSNQHRSEKLFD
ncbi:MAG: DUF4265 domain-containing protein [Saprospiraceae bacterium]|nr:DUF4265 domain-containing protein [Saprospiraceae bacterium]MCC6281565.1 DUF4265 domain-containing protein [Saprospiraceae bacterium]